MYSFLLALAFSAAAAAAIGAIATRFGAVDSRLGPGRVRRVSGLAALTSLALAALATAAHVAFDHRPGTERGLEPVAFLREHPALLVVAAITLLALAARRTTSD